MTDEPPEYFDQNGCVVYLCQRCKHWRATDGDLCEQCAKEEAT